MRSLLAGTVLIAIASGGVAAQPADCPAEASPGQTMSLSLDLAGRPGVPTGVTGQAYVDVPIGAPGIACDGPSPPADILHGEPGNVLGGPPSPDLLRGPGSPRVRVEIR